MYPRVFQTNEARVEEDLGGPKPPLLVAFRLISSTFSGLSVPKLITEPSGLEAFPTEIILNHFNRRRSLYWCAIDAFSYSPCSSF